MTDAGRIARAREFVRSLNALLKSVRLYGFDHSRSSAQFQAAMELLNSLLPGDDGAGLLLAVSGTQLLVDGAALEVSPIERSFAETLAAAGLASLHFTAGTTRDDLARFVRAFAASGGKAAGLADQLKAACGEGQESPIRVNKVRFVVEDGEGGVASGGSAAGAAAALVAQSLGPQADKLKDYLSDPRKLLQLMAAAEGLGAQRAGGSPGTAAPAAIPQPAQDGDILNVLRMLTQLAQSGEARRDAVPLQQLTQVPAAAQASMQSVLASLATAKLPAGQPQNHVLIQLAEQLAIRHALERFQRGEVKIDGVRETLNKMGQEVEKLRKILGAHEEKMARAGLAVESHSEILDRQFWAQVPDPAKRQVLAGPEAWCIPARNIGAFVEQLANQGDKEGAAAILKNYATCLRSADDEARRRAAAGLPELAKHYAAAGDEVLNFAIGQAGRQLSQEKMTAVQEPLQEGFARLSHEAASHRRYAAVGQVLNQLQNVEDSQQSFSSDLRSRVSIEVRIQDFIEEAVRNEGVPAELSPLLARLPQLTMDHVAARFARATRREECERLIALAKETQAPGLEHLRSVLERGPDAAAVGTVGLLSRLEPAALEAAIPARLAKWNLNQQDTLIRQISLGGSSARGGLLLKWFDRLDPLLRPEATDEMGMASDRNVANHLLKIASGELREHDAPYLRLKAIESLGRLREHGSAVLLRKLVESRKLLGWEHPHELRLVAAQALAKIDPSWARTGLAATGISEEELNLAPPLDPEQSAAWSRPRRYPRLLLALTLPAVASTASRKSRLAIKVLNLGGGLASSDTAIAGGTPATLELRSGLRSVRAEVLVREARREQLTFEVVRMNFEERGKLRKLLGGLQTVVV